MGLAFGPVSCIRIYARYGNIAFAAQSSSGAGIMNDITTLMQCRNRDRVEERLKALDSDRRKLAVRFYEEKQHAVRQICEMMDISGPVPYKHVETVKL